jgi:hypothetical protein
MIKKIFPALVLVFVVVVFFRPFFLQGKLPIPADTIVGLYHPYRDLYAKEYPRGIPFKNFLITDPVRQQYPWRLLAMESSSNFQLPLWNPYEMSGVPLLGSLQAGAFYPLNVLLIAFPFSLGWSLLIFFQQILAGIFVYFYLNNLRLKKVASLFGAITYAFCGFSIAWLEWGTVVHTAIWLPLVLLSIDKINLHFNNAKIFNQFIKNKELIIWSFVLLFSLVSAFFAGHLQTFFYLFLLSSVYFFARWWQFGKQKKVLFLFLIFILCFLMLTFIQWFPTLQFILASARDVDQVSWQKEGWFMPWQNLVQFIAPDFFGNPATLNYWGVWNYAEFVGYTGIVSLVMAIFALFFRRDKKTLFFGVVVFTALIFILPDILAQLPYMLQLPFLRTAQPTRLLFLIDFSLAVLAALGLDSYLHQKKKKMFLPIILLLVVVVLFWFFVLVGYKSISPELAENMLIAKRNLYLPTILLVAMLVIFIGNSIIKSRKFHIFSIVFLILLSIFDLLRFSEKFSPFTNKSYLFPQTAVLSFLQEDSSPYRIMSENSEILPPNFSIMYHIQSIDGYDPLYLLRYGELIAAIERNSPDIHAPFGFNRIITPHNIDSRLIDLLGVKYVLSLSEIHLPKYEKVFKESQTNIYRNKNVFPRAFFVKIVAASADKNESISKLFDNQINLRDVAVVENWDRNSNITSSGSASVTEYSDNKVVINTENEGSAFLVLTDTFYPTWRAKVCSDAEKECHETKIYLTDYNFRGILVTGGKHTVIFYNSLL